MNKQEFARRREQLLRMVGPGGIAILPAAPVRIRSRDVEYRFRQDSDFYYLTGFAEPDAVVVLAPGRDNGEYVMFCRERAPDKELWDGRRAGPDGAIQDYSADDAFPIDDIDDILPGIMESCNRVYYTMGLYAEFDARIADWLNSLRGRESRGVHTPREFVALDHLLHDMRLYKSRAEISAMRRSAKVAVGAHTHAMQFVRPGLYEYEVEAEYAREFRRNGAWMSYSPIVGSGINACTLHYVENNKMLNDGELLLIDAGCELDYYASDITRTIPVNGKFSPEQRAVYEIVLDAQLAAIDKTRKGNHWNEPHDAAVKVITRGLKKIGLLNGTLARLIKDEAYREFFMHRTGHWIGMDVHDVGDYKVGDDWRLLESNMITTVEPGVYIPDSRKVAARWRGIGVRIEDDVAVTSNGPDVLSKGLVKDADAIESLMQRRMNYDVIIAGGGMVGSSLALALAPLSLRVAIVEPVTRTAELQPSFDDRSTALSRSTQRMYEALQLWDDVVVAATPVKRIHVSDRGRFGFSHIDADEQGVDALGYVVINRVLGGVLQSALDAVPGLDILCPASIGGARLAPDRVTVSLATDAGEPRELTARLLVAADGARSSVREMVGIGVAHEDYGQRAIVGNVLPEKALQNCAYERFTPQGPLALLPIADGRAGFVWTVPDGDAGRILALDDAAFLAGLQDAFGYRLGAFSRVGARAAYPLTLSKAMRLTATRTALVGNAAHGLHPVAAQGFNLGLRDVAALCDCIADCGLDDPELLPRYAAWRKSDQSKLVGLTDGLVRLFASNNSAVRAARDLGMLGFDLVPGVRTLFAKHAMGLAGRLPRLSRGVPLA